MYIHRNRNSQVLCQIRVYLNSLPRKISGCYIPYRARDKRPRNILPMKLGPKDLCCLRLKVCALFGDVVSAVKYFSYHKILTKAFIRYSICDFVVSEQNWRCCLSEDLLLAINHNLLLHRWKPWWWWWWFLFHLGWWGVSCGVVF